MKLNDIDIFFKRRFDKDLFDKYLLMSMKEWVKDKRAMYRDFEVNVINDALSNYFWDTHKVDVWSDVPDLGDVYQFESFITNKYEKVMRDFFNRHR